MRNLKNVQEIAGLYYSAFKGLCWNNVINSNNINN